MANPALLSFLLRPAHRGLFDAALTVKERRSNELHLYSRETGRLKLVGYPLDRNDQKVLPKDWAAHLDHLSSSLQCHCPELQSATLLTWADGSAAVVCQHYPQNRCQLLLNLNAIHQTAVAVSRYSANRHGNELNFGVAGYQRRIFLDDRSPSDVLGGFLIRNLVPMTDAEDQDIKPAPVEDEKPVIFEDAGSENWMLFNAREQSLLAELAQGRTIKHEELEEIVNQCSGCDLVLVARLQGDHRC
ncbi:hypothetical protein C8F01DRAFT_1262054 [Mycena amicta]|nr:hypothetical protein C8F01DRAFT_1262054 [Mycena amicta]